MLPVLSLLAFTTFFPGSRTASSDVELTTTDRDLLSWFAESGGVTRGVVYSAVASDGGGDGGDRGVFAKRDILDGDVVMEMPHALALSVRAADPALTNLIPPTLSTGDGAAGA